MQHDFDFCLRFKWRKQPTRWCDWYGGVSWRSYGWEARGHAADPAADAASHALPAQSKPCRFLNFFSFKVSHQAKRFGAELNRVMQATGLGQPMLLTSHCPHCKIRSYRILHFFHHYVLVIPHNLSYWHLHTVYRPSDLKCYSSIICDFIFWNCSAPGGQ